MDSGDRIDKFLEKLSSGFNSIVRKPIQAPQMSPAADFFSAVRNNQAEAVRRYLEHGQDPNAYNGNGKTALHIAAMNNAMDAARVLLEHHADPRLERKDKPGHTPLEDAATFDKHEMVELLVRMGGYMPSAGAHGWSLLHRACEKGQHRIVEALLKSGVDANERTENGSTPLLIVVSAGHWRLAQSLLQFPSVAEGMNQYFVETDPRKRTAFHLAVERGRKSVIERMVELGADVNAPDAKGETPLLKAIENADLELVSLLVEHGADLNKPCGPEGAALIYACRTGTVADGYAQAPLVDLLISLGADTRAVSAEGKLPLHYALSPRVRPNVLTTLLRYPVEQDMIDMRDREDGYTPLIEAVKYNSASNVAALLQAGANPELLDGHGRSALSYARESCQAQIVTLLEEVLSRQYPENKRYLPPRA